MGNSREIRAHTFISSIVLSWKVLLRSKMLVPGSCEALPNCKIDILRSSLVLLINFLLIAHVRLIKFLILYELYLLLVLDGLIPLLVRLLDILLPGHLFWLLLKLLILHRLLVQLLLQLRLLLVVKALLMMVLNFSPLVVGPRLQLVGQDELGACRWPYLDHVLEHIWVPGIFEVVGEDTEGLII